MSGPLQWLQEDLALKEASRLANEDVLTYLNADRTQELLEADLFSSLNKLNTQDKHLSFKERLEFAAKQITPENAQWVNTELNKLPGSIDPAVRIATLTRIKDLAEKNFKLPTPLVDLHGVAEQGKSVTVETKNLRLKRVDTRVVRLEGLSKEEAVRTYIFSLYTQRRVESQPVFYTGLRVDGKALRGPGLLSVPTSEQLWIGGYKGLIEELPFLGVYGPAALEPGLVVKRTEIRDVIAGLKSSNETGSFLVVTGVTRATAENTVSGVTLDAEYRKFLLARYQIPDLLQPSDFLLLTTHFAESGLYKALREVEPTKRNMLRHEIIGLNQVLGGRIQTEEDFKNLVSNPEEFINKSLVASLYPPIKESKGAWLCRLELYAYGSL